MKTVKQKSGGTTECGTAIVKLARRKRKKRQMITLLKKLFGQNKPVSKSNQRFDTVMTELNKKTSVQSLPAKTIKVKPDSKPTVKKVAKPTTPAKKTATVKKPTTKSTPAKTTKKK